MHSFTAAGASTPVYFIVCHIHPTSARLRYFLPKAGHLTLPGPLPRLSVLADNPNLQGQVAGHPRQHILALSSHLNMSDELLQLHNGFRCWVETARGYRPVYLLEALGPDPFPAAELGRWIELPDCYCVSENERLLMRHIYDWFLGHEI